MTLFKKAALGVSVPLGVFLLAGFTLSEPAESPVPEIADMAIETDFGITCAVVLCPGGTTCIDTKNGPQCVPLDPPRPK